MKSASKESILEALSEGLRDAEYGIQNHPQETILVYQNGKTAYWASQPEEEHPDWAKEMSLQKEELKLMTDYLFAMSFVSAWFHVQGDVERQHATVQTASSLVSGLGFSSEDVINRIRNYEFIWRKGLRDSGIGQKLPVGYKIAFFVILAIAGYSVYTWIT